MPNLFEKLELLQQKRYKDKIKKHPYPTKIKFHIGSLVDAINGFIWTLKTQPNFTIEIIAFIIIGYFYLFLYLLNIKFERYEILIIFIFTCVLLAFELVNTSIEALSDEVANKEYKEFIRIAKDTSATAVLLISLSWIMIVIYFTHIKLIEIVTILF